jgi:hypothetical protein
MWSRRSVVATGIGALLLAGARRARAAAEAEAGDAADRVEIQELVQRERLARDLKQWDVMAAAYHSPASGCSTCRTWSCL